MIAQDYALYKYPYRLKTLHVVALKSTAEIHLHSVTAFWPNPLISSID